jgi:hypothetical protein
MSSRLEIPYWEKTSGTADKEKEEEEEEDEPFGGSARIVDSKEIGEAGSRPIGVGKSG